MLEMRTKDGQAFDLLDAAVTVTPKGGAKTYTWADVHMLLMLEPEFGVTEGMFGPPGGPQMPIRGLRFTDTSDFFVEVPMPVIEAQAVGQELAKTKIDVRRSMPSAIRAGEQRLRRRGA